LRFPFVNGFPRCQQLSHRTGSAIDSVADLACDRKLHGSNQTAIVQQLPEILEIGKTRVPERPFP
jgi:hypothetical protein